MGDIRGLMLLLWAVALLLVLYKVVEPHRNRDLLSLLIFILMGEVLAYYEGVSPELMLAGIMVFNGLVSTYHSRDNYAFLVLAAFVVFSLNQLATYVSQAMLLGFLSGAYYFMKPNTHRSPRLERKRDVIQVLFGVILICVFALSSPAHAKLFVLSMILVFSLVGNYAVSNKRGEISRFLSSLERRDAALGQGAMWLVIGTLVAISFLNGHETIIVIAAVFIGDAVATLVGTAYRVPLPYNKRKSSTGTFAYFVATGVVSFPFIGVMALPVAVVAALVESLDNHVDDNLDTALAVTILVLIFVSRGWIA